MLRKLLWINAAFLLLGGAACLRTTDPLPGFPRLILWAWERPEDLRWIEANTTGVAFLAKTIDLSAQAAYSKPRLQPLLVPPKAKLISVVRLKGPGSPAKETERIASEIAATTTLPRVMALQIDFDALRSQRAFYNDILRSLRRKLPPRFPLLITALVSWCAGDNWIDDLDIDNATPMYFRMGPERPIRGAHLRSPLCLNSVGLSTDELLKVQLRNRIFLFNPRPWTPDALHTALAEIHHW